LATTFGSEMAKWLPESLGPTVNSVAGFLIVFVGVLLLAGFVELLLSFAVRAAEWTWTDRALGAAFGVVRGLLIVVAVVLAAGMTPLPREPFWRNAVFSGPLETVALSLRPMLPEPLAQRVRFR
jgi:membrane protein required for colicin V production